MCPVVTYFLNYFLITLFSLKKRTGEEKDATIRALTRTCGRSAQKQHRHPRRPASPSCICPSCRRQQRKTMLNRSTPVYQMFPIWNQSWLEINKLMFMYCFFAKKSVCIAFKLAWQNSELEILFFPRAGGNKLSLPEVATVFVSIFVCFLSLIQFFLFFRIVKYFRHISIVQFSCYNMVRNTSLALATPLTARHSFSCRC